MLEAQCRNSLENPPRSRLAPPRSAWLGSALLHAGLIAVLAVAFRTAPMAIQSEAPRAGSIVLVERSSTQPDRYFNAEDSSADRSQPLGKAVESTAALPDSGEVAEYLAEHEPKQPANAAPLAASELTGLVQTAQLDGARQPARIHDRSGEAALIAKEQARLRAGRPSGRPADLELFGARGVGHSFVFLIDRSQSMGGDGLNALAAAERKLLDAVEGLEANHRFQVIAYNDRIRYADDDNRGAMLPATGSNKQQAKSFIQGMVAAKGTNHAQALLLALNRRPDVIFLLTDGEAPALTPVQQRQINVRNGGRTSIHCLQFGSGPPSRDETFLAKLARLNRGSLTYIDVLKR